MSRIFSSKNKSSATVRYFRYRAFLIFLFSSIIKIYRQIRDTIKILLGLARPSRSTSAISLIRSIRFKQVAPLPVRSCYDQEIEQAMSKSGHHHSIFQEVFSMNAVDSDVSKGKSTVAILRPMGKVVQMPKNIPHDMVSLERLARIRFWHLARTPESSWRQPVDTTNPLHRSCMSAESLFALSIRLSFIAIAPAAKSGR